MKNNFSEVGFFFDDAGVMQGVSIGESPSGGIEGIFESKTVQPGFTHIVNEGIDIGSDAVQIKLDDVFENELMFGTIEIVGVDDVEKFGDNFTVTNEHSSENLFFNFDAMREIVSIHN